MKESIISSIEQRVFDIMLDFNNEFGCEMDQTLTSNQQLLLYLVTEKEVKQVKHLAAAMNISASAVSQMITKLEAQDIIIREIDPDNRRNTVLKTGEKGKQMMKEMEIKRTAIVAKYLKRLKTDDLEQLDAIMKRLYAIIQQEKRGNQS
ncbi:MarR family winged helix-turn-helix transcriptional regulator [Salisediminibacterium selenitireducens]|uniref:Transcriptional regulator, MarR family n=1 Tax=Bacillus selenitireducens (strain ATCC 700615 / DSM 15326 / MLS10) TaxID=439292 RepID=D6XT64_BACIE|nr:MarR family transcriptional regulator [Salisediminibacterium selenitireducens]ADH99000.1 transcriptional regulator, MarR family [[Bacillus] selenitireducens MLS10]